MYRKPLYALLVEAEVETPLKITNESYMGPTAHIRLLTLLASETKISQLGKSISSQITLAQLEQLCTPGSIRKVLIQSKKQITSQREVGHTRFRVDHDLEYACFAYTAAAELAAALVAFDNATQGTYRMEIMGVRREQVLCLGNAAEMALGQEFYDRALCYATAAVQCTKTLPTEEGPDGVDVSIREKNIRRVARAIAGLPDA